MILSELQEIQMIAGGVHFFPLPEDGKFPKRIAILAQAFAPAGRAAARRGSAYGGLTSPYLDSFLRLP